MSFLELLGLASIVVYFVGLVYYFAVLVSGQARLSRIWNNVRPPWWEYPVLFVFSVFWPIIKAYAFGQEVMEMVRG